MGEPFGAPYVLTSCVLNSLNLALVPVLIYRKYVDVQSRAKRLQLFSYHVCWLLVLERQGKKMFFVSMGTWSTDDNSAFSVIFDWNRLMVKLISFSWYLRAIKISRRQLFFRLSLVEKSGKRYEFFSDSFKNSCPFGEKFPDIKIFTKVK